MNIPNTYHQFTTFTVCTYIIFCIYIGTEIMTIYFEFPNNFIQTIQLGLEYLDTTDSVDV